MLIFDHEDHLHRMTKKMHSLLFPSISIRPILAEYKNVEMIECGTRYNVVPWSCGGIERMSNQFVHGKYRNIGYPLSIVGGAKRT